MSAQGLVGDRLRRGLLGVGRLLLALVDDRGDRDDPGVALLRRGRLLDDLRVDLLRGDGDPLLGREAGLDLGVDELLDDERGELVRAEPAAWSDWTCWPASALVNRPAATAALTRAMRLLDAPDLDRSRAPRSRRA